ncbi:MAG: type II secretion system major pseudopilin GspG [Armatimonadetes bacterium]|nr:type II secretion system major pseudopilin GspG [Armatimonadota bacterium]
MKRCHAARGRSGFTLIELLVVILILAILAALIVPRVVGRTSDAKRAKAASDIATLSSLLQQYRVDNDAYPTTEEGLQALWVKPSDAKNWRGPYTSKDIPVDPWGNEYVYESPGPDDQDYLITSYGADGAPGGEGDAEDITSE